MSSARFYFRAAAVIFLAFGIVAAIAPDQYVSLLSVGPSAGGRLWGRSFGAASIGLGVMLWMIDPVAERERRIGAIGSAAAFAVAAVADVAGTIGGDFVQPVLGWVFVGFNTAMMILAVMVLRDQPSEVAA